jgi:hypothetical protein
MQDMTEKDRKFADAEVGELGCSYIAGCDNVALDNDYDFCDYHMMPQDGRADPYRDSAPYIGYDV